MATTPESATLLDIEIDAATEAVSALMVESSVNVTATELPAVTSEPTISANTSLVVMFLAPAPEPAPESATVPLVPANAKDAATAIDSMLFIAVALTITSLATPLAMTVEFSTAARLLPVRVFSATVTETPRAPETSPVETEIAIVAATTLAVIAAWSSTFSATVPPAFKSLLVSSAWVEPPILLIAVATPTAPAMATVPLLTDTLIPIAIELAVMTLLAPASIETAPLANTSEFSIPARTALVIVFVVAEAAPESEIVTSPEPTVTEAARTTSVASMLLVLSASRVIGPTAVTNCDSAASASSIVASTMPPMVLIATATPTAPESEKFPPPALTETARLVPSASMSLSEVALILSAPPASSVESNTCA